MEGTVDVVCGRKIVRREASVLHAAAVLAAHVLVDVGTGDGRWAYRLARAHPGWLCIGIDPNAGGLRGISHRASRKAVRGGAANAWFVRARVEDLPGALAGIADAIHVYYPWSGLLSAILEPRPGVLAGVARLGRHGARVEIVLNVSALDGAGRVTSEAGTLVARLGPAYAAAGITLTRASLDRAGRRTTWGRRLGQLRSAPALVLIGRVC